MKQRIRSDWPAYLVLGIALTVTFVAALLVEEATRAAEAARFRRVTAQVQRGIDNGLNKYLTLLDTVGALAVARVSMAPAQFHTFVAALDLPKNYPGLSGLGWTLKVPSERKAAVVQELRRIGFADFRIWPESSREETLPVLLIEPLHDQNRAILGYDLTANPDYLAPMTAATEAGKATATAKLPSLYESGGSDQDGFLIFVPGYAGGPPPEEIEARRAEVAGFVYGVFHARQLLERIVGENGHPLVAVRIHDGLELSEESRLYESPDWKDLPVRTQFQSTNRLAVAGRPWTLHFRNRPQVAAEIDPSPIALFGGLAVSGLLWWITITQTKARRSAERSAAEIQELNNRLEQRVKERTSDLEAAVNELKAFTYSVSHDLRAPLRGISGFSRVLVEEHASQLDSEGRRLLGIVIGEAKRMGRLIDDLLNLSRISRQELKRLPVDMTELVQQVFDSLARQAVRPMPRLDLKPLRPAAGDPALLRQVFFNLLDNAVKFSGGKGDPCIEVGGSDNTDGYAYYVKDNGVGFDAKYAGKLFGVFQRLHSQEEFEGTGVGLAIVHRIIDRHGGKIWAESVVNEGATFFFTLPPSEPN